jgi:hypothetical protein
MGESLENSSQSAWTVVRVYTKDPRKWANPDWEVENLHFHVDYTSEG